MEVHEWRSFSFLFLLFLRTTSVTEESLLPSSTPSSSHHRKIACFIATRKILGFYMSVVNSSRWTVLKEGRGTGMSVPTILCMYVVCMSRGCIGGCMYVVCNHVPGPSSPTPLVVYRTLTWVPPAVRVWCTYTKTQRSGVDCLQCVERSGVDVCLFYCHSKSVWSNLIDHVT
jgi:hypothetical protein